MPISEIVLDFLEDAKDQADRFESSLLKLDQDPKDRSSLSSLFRAIHSIKGASYYTGFQYLGRFVHRVESLLEPIAKGGSEVEKRYIDALFLVLDFVKQSLDVIKETGEDPPVPQELEQEVERAFSDIEEAPPSETFDFMPSDVQPIMGEDADPELFSIFIDTLREQLKIICEIVASGKLFEQRDWQNQLDKAFHRILGSSRYMDYEVLVRFFNGWQNLLSDLISKGSSRDELIGVSSQCLVYLGKVLPVVDVDVLIKVFEAKGDEVPEEARPFTEVELLEEEIEAAFSNWLEEAPEERVEEREEIEQQEERIPERLEYVIEEAVEEELPREIVEEEEEVFAPVYRDEVVLPKEIPHRPAEMLRVDPAKVDHLLNQVGELVIRRSHFVMLNSELKRLAEDWFNRGLIDIDHKKVLEKLWQEHREAVSLLGRITADLQDAVMKIRMLPLIQLFQRFPRVVRDHAAQYGKSVRMVIKGGETEIDRRILEQLYEPMVHILRNAVAHGIEVPEARRNLGKPEEGTITISAYYRGQYVIIEITDDGSGIALERLRNVLVEKGIYKVEEVEKMGQEELFETIFLPGVSTSSEVDETSGRGIGLDVVRDECRKINGHVTVKSWPGQGTQFVIQIPLTLAIIPALLVKIRGDIYTLPLASVGEVHAFDERRIKKMRNTYFLILEDRTIPLLFPEYLFPRRGGKGRSSERGDYIVILRTPVKEVGLLVDQFLGQQEVVIKPIEDVMDVIQGYAGATILGDGTISLIIDVPYMIDFAEKFCGVKDY
ncbi:MAG: chemotaxis protein CheA [Syntrophobacterales bacterium]|nr:chemotaxis protein CheA [Syntrophobacterales bacterium]